MKYAPYRRQAALPRLVKESFPKEFIFIDTETKPVSISEKVWMNKLYLGVAIYVKLNNHADITRRDVFIFRNTAELLQIFSEYSKRKSRLIVVGHNISFDVEVLNLPMAFKELGCSHEYPIKNGHSFIWSVQTGKGTLLFIDTGNYCSVSLAQIGKDIGIEKKPIDFATAEDDYLIEYCINDVEITEKFLLEYIRFMIHNNMGEFKLTIASQALTSYRHRFMKTQPVFHNIDRVNEIEKYSYFGGRTEALYIGKIPHDKIYYLDVSSEYPAAMIATKLPYELVSLNTAPVRQAFDYHLKHNYMIVDCLIKTDKPVFPMRASIKHTKTTISVEVINKYTQNQPGYKIIYPIGEFRTWLHHAEFLYALEHNMICHVFSYALYKKADLFSDYVHTLYELKAKYSQEGNKSFRLVTKILQNALYGKWGQEYHETVHLGTIPSESVEVTYGYSDKYGYTFTDINWFGEVYRTYQTGLSTYAFPAIAGAITSNARMIIWKYREKAGHENVFYMDTDSLFVNQIGYERLEPDIKPNQIGMLEHKDTGSNVIIYGNKDYVFEHESTHKGIGKNAEQIDTNKWRFIQFEGFKAWRNAGANRPPITQYVDKQRNPVYDKGILSESGHITPFVLTSSLTPLVFSLQDFQAKYLAQTSLLSLQSVESHPEDGYSNFVAHSDY